ncbi:MAG: L-histidine N(alpha)-methyltransferase [Alphaproteobacteria bacterium]
MPQSHPARAAGDRLAFFLDLAPPRADFLTDVREGFLAQPKSLSPKYFYDRRGSVIFDEICRAPEYYVTRTEMALLEAIGPEVRTLTGPGAKVIEYGSGSSWKIRTLLNALEDPQVYVAIDISGDHLLDAAEQIAGDFPRVAVGGVCADFSQHIDLTDEIDRAPGRHLGFFPGSSIGNFTRPHAEAFLTRAAGVIGRGGAMLLGVDLVKDKGVLERAYNDRAGHTAAFNLNVIARMRNELKLDIAPEDFEHFAFYNEAEERIEMHLRARRDLAFQVGNTAVTMAAGETLHTENSHKYTLGGVQTMARRAGFDPVRSWTDPQGLFSLHYLAVP